MRYIISGKNLDITEGLRSAVTDKLGKLERYFTPDTEVHVTLSVEKGACHDGRQRGAGRHPRHRRRNAR